ncbi:remodeling and spacing factor 1 isoform X2 [Gasterosteus aculeatus]
MAAPVVARSSGPALCPSFAEVCSFLERFGAVLDLPEMTFPQMERYLRDKTTVPKPLVELHVKLLRKLGRSVTTDRWEKYLAKVCQELNGTWAWELEQEGYMGMSMECKSCILKYLCECQFDDNLKFKTAINEEEPEKMRLQPVGRDQQGLMYWLQLDHEQNIRLYTEEQDDLDGSTWNCIVRTRNDLAEALELLKSQVEGKQNPDADPNQNLYGSRSSSPTQKDEVDEAIGVTEPSRTAEQRTDRPTVHPVKEEEPLTQEVKLEETLPTKQANTEVEVKEEKVDSKSPPVFDNRVSTITTIVKLESKDPDAPKNAVSVVMAPGATATKPGAIKEGEAERAVVRSSQQAKIPLKKRELKIAESYHGNHLNNSNNNNNSSIIVCNPSVIQTKDASKEGKLPGPLAPPGGLTTSQPPPQQPLVTASRQELSNGGAFLPLLHKEGQNGVIGVIGQVGVVSHVGVIRSPSERHRAPGAEQQEQNGPGLDQREPAAEQDEREVSRQSVLVRKGAVEGGAAGAASDAQMAEKLPPPPPLKSDPLPDAVGGKVVSISLSSLSMCQEDPKQQAAGDPGEETTAEPSDRGTDTREQKEDDGDKRTSAVCGHPLAGEGATDDHKKNNSTLGKSEAESESTALLLQADQLDTKDHRGDGVNGGLAAPAKVKEAGLGSAERQGPLEEASSELQKEGIRLKIKIPPHRRNKLKGKGGKEEQKEREQEVNDDGRLLRRSARICRPSSKAADSGGKKPQKKQTLLGRARGEEEEEEDDEEEEDEEEQSSTAKNDGKTEAVGQIRKQKGKRRHRRPRWSNIRTKRRKLTEGEEAEGWGRKGGEGESEGERDSEESFKSGEIPSEDACSHCGLPNHPELILLCDSCDSGYHTACLRPPVMLIPDGEWFCPPCQHKLLCEKLEEQLQNLDSALKKRERAERRRERLVYVGISVENIIPEGDQPEEEKSTKKKDPKKSKNLGRRSTRTRKNISYRFDDFDDAIDEAIEEDIRDICGGAGQGRDIAAILSEEGAKGSQRPIRSQADSARNRKRRRLNDLESDSTAAESEDEFMLSNSSEDEDFAASGPDDDEVEDEEAGSVESGSRSARAVRGLPKQRPGIKKRRDRKRPRRRRRRSSEEEEEEEESDEEIGSDQYSDMSDSDADKKRRGLRRGQRQQVNYRETSESSDNSRASTKNFKVKGRGRPRKDHLSSDYSDASPSTRETEEDDDYEDEEEDGQRRRGKKRRREEEDLRRNRVRQKRRRHGEEEREQGSLLKKTRLEGRDKDKARRLRRPQREEEDAENMGRGKRREILSLQRRKRLAQMLKKRRPSTDDESESSEDDSDSTTSSSEEDRPVRKRLNRIDSDDDEEEDEEEEEEGGRPEKAPMCSAVEKRSDSDTQEKGRGRSLSPSNRHRTSRGPAKPGDGSPAEPGDGAGSDGGGRHNGPSNPEEKDEVEEEGHTDSLNSAQNSPRS